ncbi:hypothetical protein DDE82_008665 [Stemphylium lycopersici]|uniref:Uncharacterized protein n=1 Tax=Stemphylium lycopersici TaxID=183478 RepID=A0A364MTD6_STELY|nr:hypothetical protein DDE82_008665 [Stemphylium lycopersici]RAR02853.1 hypothetical protein DDE83_008435 [Stemphylium lycopersici]
MSSDSIYCHSDNCCDHKDAWDRSLVELECEYVYLDTVNDFLGQSNPEWLEMMREAHNSTALIDLNLDMESQCPTIYIRFHGRRAPKAFERRVIDHFSLQFLKTNVLMGLRDSHGYGWIIGESSGLYTRHLAMPHEFDKEPGIAA